MSEKILTDLLKAYLAQTNNDTNKEKDTNKENEAELKKLFRPYSKDGKDSKKPKKKSCKSSILIIKIKSILKSQIRFLNFRSIISKGCILVDARYEKNTI